MRAARRNQRDRLFYLGVAGLSVALALGLTLLLGSWLAPTVTPLFFVAVMVSAWLGGWEAGLLAMVLSTLAIGYFFVEPVHSLEILSLGSLVRLGVFAIAAGCISWLSQSRRQALAVARASNQALREALEQEAAMRSLSDQTATTLRQTEARLRAVIANLPQGAVFVVDQDLRYRLAEGQAIDRANLNSADLVGKTIWEALEPDLAARYEPIYRQALNGVPFSWEHYSHDRYYISHGTPLVNDRGEIEAVLAMSYDISDRKRTEAALRASEEKYRSLFDSIDEGFCLIEMMFDASGKPVDYRFVETNAVFDRQTGLVNATGKTALELVPNLERKWIERYGRVALTGESIRLEDDSAPMNRWFDLYASRVGGANSALVAIVFRDITDRKQAEAAIAADLHDTQLLRDLGARLVKEGNIQALYQEITAAAIALTHADAGSVQILDPDTQELVLLATQGATQTMLKHFHRVDAHSNTSCGIALRNGDRTFVDFDSPAHEDPDGSMRMHREAGFLSAQSTPLISRSGRAIGMVSTHWRERRRPSDRELRFLDLLARQAADLIEQRQFELDLARSRYQFEKIAETTPDLVYVYDLVNNCNLYVNSGISRVLGYLPDQIAELGSSLIATLIHPDDIPGVIEGNQRFCLLGDTEVYDHEIRLRHANGEYRWLRCRDSIFERAEDGVVTQIIGTAQDITDLKYTEIEREKLLSREQAARTEAEQANRIKDEFLAVLSHELRSPLNPILGWSKLLRQGKLNPTKTEQALQSIERNAQLQAELIEDLLDISRILRGKLSLNVSPVNLATVIRSAMETVRLAAEAKAIDLRLANLEFGLAADNNPKFMVSGDATRLQQVVWNLLSNAVKFTPTGGQVSVELEWVDHDVQIMVRDNGKGIVPEFLPYVFDYFRQEDGATTRKFGGLGLGLAIVRQIVELHGGTVRATSPGEGQGATFTVRLPLLRSLDDRDKATDPPSRTPSSSQPLTGLQILVVDDDPDSRDFTAFVVEQAGATVTTATSAAEAIARLTQSQQDLLLSDVGMPEMDGYMMMQRIRELSSEQNGEIKAIALTAYAGDFNQQRAMQAGFQRHVAKPVEPEELVRAIVGLLN
jgi:PAS domain S-box-containing protein